MGVVVGLVHSDHTSTICAVASFARGHSGVRVQLSLGRNGAVDMQLHRHVMGWPRGSG